MLDSDGSPVATKKRRLNRDLPEIATKSRSARLRKVILSSPSDKYSSHETVSPTTGHHVANELESLYFREETGEETTKGLAKNWKGDEALQELRRRNAGLGKVASERKASIDRGPKDKLKRVKLAKPAKPRKSKHRIIVHEKSVIELEDLVATQLPQDNLSSSPWRQRGAIIQKRLPREATIEAPDELHGSQPSGSLPVSDKKSPQSSPPAPFFPPSSPSERANNEADKRVQSRTGVGRMSYSGPWSKLDQRGIVHESETDEDCPFSTLIATSQRMLRSNASAGNTLLSHRDYNVELGWERGKTSSVLSHKPEQNWPDSMTKKMMESGQEIRSTGDVSQCLSEAALEGDDLKLLALDPRHITTPIESLAASLPKQPKETAPASSSPPPLPQSAREEVLSLQKKSAGSPSDAFGQDELADLPSDAFDDSEDEFATKPVTDTSVNFLVVSSQLDEPVSHRRRQAPHKNLQQRTLFGEVAQVQGRPVASTQGRQLSFVADLPPETPTHHELAAEDFLQTWIYPTNLGNIRDYQFSIVAKGLFHNTLVALPTGLGKTFIAATIMLNWYRWTRTAQIFFVAPTKPLVSQQIDACFRIAGIPQSDTSLLTGTVSAHLRTEEYAEKRVFFMTPQTLVNDLKSGKADPKRIVLLVIDEAHRATGAYAYVELVKLIRQFNKSFRVLALTATPGASVEAVQAVMDGLNVAKVEIRHENSLDIRDFVYERRTDILTFDNSEELEMIMDFCSRAIQPVLNNLCQFNAYWSKDPMQLTAYKLTKSRQQWMMTAGKSASFAIKGMLNRIFSVLASLAHSISLLKFHGIGPFYHNMVAFRSSHGDSEKSSKYEKMILDSEPFKKMMSRMQFWINNPTFIGHPKLEELQNIVLTHFLNVGKDSPSRVMIFSAFRDSAEEIVRILTRSSPEVRPHVFVGQQASKRSEGMDQKTQLEIIEKFKNGTYNVLVATSIGEEGLDIGQVDLIICFDSSASPIRMLQRMGRTGRKRAGRIILLLMKGKEEESFRTAKDAYEKIQGMIEDGRRFKFHDDLSPRILPRKVKPVPDKRLVEIPPENSQAGLPEPKRGRGKPPKRAPKRYNMPDNVQSGFVKASGVGPDGEISVLELAYPLKKGKGCAAITKKNFSLSELLEPVTLGEDSYLTREELHELDRNYRNVYIGGDGPSGIEICAPSVTLHPVAQQQLRPFRWVQHSAASIRFAKTIARMQNAERLSIDAWNPQTIMTDLDELCGEFGMPLTSATTISKTPTRTTANPRGATTTKPAPARKAAKERSKTTIQAAGAAVRARNAAIAYSDFVCDTEDAEGTATSSAPLTPPGMALPTQGEDLGSDDTEGEEPDDAEMDSDMADWIVGSDEEIPVEASSAPTLASLSRSPMRRKQPKRQLDSLFTSEPNSSTNTAPDIGSDKGSADTAELHDRNQRRRRRAVVAEDSDSANDL